MRIAWHRVLIVLLLAGGEPARGDEPPAPKTEVDALVVDAGGQPVADARVWVMQSETAESRSDAAGRAKIVLNENHSGGVVLAAVGDRLGVAQFRPARRQGKPSAARIELGQTRSFAVTVQDADGQPLAGARVGTFFSHGPVTRLELPVVDSGAGGKAMLRVPAGARFVAAAATSADGLAGGLAQSASDDAATITLRPLTTVDGQLAGPNGEPYADHDVIASVLIGEGDSAQLWWKWFSAGATSDGEGKFQLTGMVTGTYQVKHRAPQGGDWQPLETVKVAGGAGCLGQDRFAAPGAAAEA